MKKISRKNTERTSVKVHSVMSDGILITVFGNDYYLSYDRIPWFRQAKVSDIFDVEMFGDDGIRWNALDVDLEIDSLKYPERYPLVMKRTPEEILW